MALDLSAAFDTLDFSTILQRLQFTFGISGMALDWVRTYLVGRTQYVKIGDTESGTTEARYGVPQGSCLGPFIFSLYVAPIINVISAHKDLMSHQYADDTQLCIGITAVDHNDGSSLMSLDRCTSAVQEWFLQNGLCLNPTK